MKTRGFNLIKILIILFVIFALCVAVYQVYFYFYKSVSTEYAVTVQVDDSISVDGIFVRNEKELDISAEKYMDIVVGDGEKVGKDGVIANAYSSEDAAKVQSQIREYEDKIKEYEQVTSLSSTAGGNIAYESDIEDNLNEIVRQSAEHNAIDAFHYAQEFYTNTVKQKIVNGEITDYSGTIENLKNELSQLKASASATVSNIVSPDSGYFCSSADGFETQLDLDSLTDMDLNGIENLKTQIKESSYESPRLGKIVSGSDWRVLVVVPYHLVDKFNSGDMINIRVPDASNQLIECTIYSITKEGDDAIMILESNMVVGSILSMRLCEVDVIIKTYSGIRIDKNAIRKVDGQDGVYISVNGVLKYRKIEVLYIGDSFAVIKNDEQQADSVKVYDEVVIKGSGLYEGKVI